MQQIYLDNAATSFPKPLVVQKSVSNALMYYGANPGRSAYPMAIKTTEMVYKTREKICDFFNAVSADKVIFTKNCTESINIVVNSQLKHGDHVIISDLEHNAVLRPIVNKGIDYTVLETFPHDTMKNVENLRASIKPNTKMLICTVASNVFGFRLPIGRMCALCRMYNIQTCIDAAQGAGVIDIDMQRDMIDFLCMPSHKALYGIMGGGVLIAQKELDPLCFGGTGTNSLETTMPEDFPERLESGTLNIPCIASISAGIDYINSIGREKIFSDEIRKIKKVYDAIKNDDRFILYTERPTKENFVPVLSFNVKDKHCEDIGEFLGRNYICVRCGLHCSSLAHRKMNTLDGTVRISPSLANGDFHINQFIKIIKNH